MIKLKNSPWDLIADWYIQRAGDKGDINQRTVINPAILECLGKIKGKNILDAGCGHGYLSRMLEKQDAHIIGIDSSKKLIDYACSRGGTTKYIQSDLFKVNELFSREEFDIIILNMVIHNISDLETLCKKLSWVLKNQGDLIITTLHPCFIIPQFFRWEDDSRLVMTGYFDLPSPLTRRLDKSSTIEIPFYHRTLEDYVKVFARNNLLVIDLKELRKSEESLRKGKNSNIKRKFPTFLLIHYKKIELPNPR